MPVAGVLAADRRVIGPAAAVAPDRLRRAYEQAGASVIDGPEGRGTRIPPR